MSTQPFDYSAIVADLEAKKAAIDAMLASIRSAMALGALGQASDSPGMPGGASASSMFGGDVPDGAFLGKSIPEATKLYLEIVKKKQTTREVAEALVKGGMESTSTNFGNIVHAVLNRTRKSPNSPFVKLGSHWGLKVWYPKGIGVTASVPPKKGKKKSRKATKSAESEPKAKAQTVVSGPQVVSDSGASSSQSERVLKLLRTIRGMEFTSQDIATQLGLSPKIVPLTMGNLVRSHKVNKTAEGKFLIAPDQEMSAAV
jgi:hypothetical protein